MNHPRNRERGHWLFSLDLALVDLRSCESLERDASFNWVKGVRRAF